MNAFLFGQYVCINCGVSFLEFTEIFYSVSSTFGSPLCGKYILLIDQETFDLRHLAPQLLVVGKKYP